MPATLQDAEHIVFVSPLWLGTMPALLKGFLEQVMRPDVALAYPALARLALPRPCARENRAASW